MPNVPTIIEVGGFYVHNGLPHNILSTRERDKINLPFEFPIGGCIDKKTNIILIGEVMF